jgi:hypothetical protein
VAADRLNKLIRPSPDLFLLIPIFVRFIIEGKKTNQKKGERKCAESTKGALLLSSWM